VRRAVNLAAVQTLCAASGVASLLAATASARVLALSRAISPHASMS